MVHWIESPDMDNCGNSIANTCVQAPTSRRRAFIRNKTSPASAGNTGELWITQPIARSLHRRGDGSFECLPYQLSMVRYAPTMVVTGNGESGFDSGEGA